jgi:hypothetical protein
MEFDTHTYRYINILLIYRYVTHFPLCHSFPVIYRIPIIQISIESILCRELIERTMDREAFGLSGYARPVSMITLTIIVSTIWLRE